MFFKRNTILFKAAQFFVLIQTVKFTDRMANLLPSDKKQVSVNVLPRREPFEILYRLNCDNLCADFREDLHFRFSWGITALIQRFAGRNSHHISFHNHPQRVKQ